MLAAVLLQASFQVLPIFLRGTITSYLQAFGFRDPSDLARRMANVLVLGAEINWWFSRGRSRARQSQRAGRAHQHASRPPGRAGSPRCVLGRARHLKSGTNAPCVRCSRPHRHSTAEDRQTPPMSSGRAEALAERAGDLLLELRLLGEERAEVLAREDEESEAVFAVTVAVRGRSSSNEISPKKSPPPIVRISEPSFVTDLTVDDDEELAACRALAARTFPPRPPCPRSPCQFAELAAREVGEEGQRPSASAFVSWEEGYRENLHRVGELSNRWRSACAAAHGGCSHASRHRRAPPPSVCPAGMNTGS